MKNRCITQARSAEGFLRKDRHAVSATKATRRAALRSAGVSPALSLLLLAMCLGLWLDLSTHAAESPLLEIDTGARPPGVSVAVSPEFPINTGGLLPAVSSAVTADLVINTRGSGAVGFFNSAYLTIDTRGVGSLSVPVKAINGLGANLAGVTVTARQNGLIVATATTAANGAATLTGLLAGYYELRAEKPGYLTQPRPHQRVPEDVSPAQAFVLTTPPVTPVLANSVTAPAASLLAGPNININQSTQLKVFQGGASGSFALLVWACFDKTDREKEFVGWLLRSSKWAGDRPPREVWRRWRL